MGIRCTIELTSREIVNTRPGGSDQRFEGIAQGTNRVQVAILVNGEISNSAISQVLSNGRFEALLTVPEGLPPGNVITIRVRSVTTAVCKIEQPVSSVPIVGQFS